MKSPSTGYRNMLVTRDTVMMEYDRALSYCDSSVILVISFSKILWIPSAILF